VGHRLVDESSSPASTKGVVFFEHRADKTGVLLHNNITPEVGAASRAPIDMGLKVFIALRGDKKEISGHDKRPTGSEPGERLPVADLPMTARQRRNVPESRGCKERLKWAAASIVRFRRDYETFLGPPRPYEPVVVAVGPSGRGHVVMRVHEPVPDHLWRPVGHDSG
jgi:hypothetical protein